MVAIIEQSSSSAAVPVALAAREEASGLANMVGQYLEQMLADSPDKRAEAGALRGRLGLHARQGDVAVTIVFADDGVLIEEGLREPNAVIAGEVEFLMHVLAGRANPIWEMGEGRVRVQAGLRHPLFAYQAYHLMRLPDVHVWSGLPRPPAGVLMGVAAAALIVVVWRMQTARSRS